MASVSHAQECSREGQTHGLPCTQWLQARAATVLGEETGPTYAGVQSPGMVARVPGHCGGWPGSAPHPHPPPVSDDSGSSGPP